MMKFIYVLLLFSVSFQSLSQKSITTQFSQNGTLLAQWQDKTSVIASFEADATCTVLDYVGKDFYKVTFEGVVGYVDSQYLVITEDMLDLFYEYQEQERIKTMEAEKNRKAKVQDIVRKNEEAKRQLALQELEKKERALQLEKKRQDSIAQQLALDNKTKEEASKLQISKTKNEPLNVELNNKHDETCSYSINEFDTIDRIQIIRTNPESVADNLTFELFKRGKSKQLFVTLFEDLGCASYLPGNRSYVRITLENNLKVTLYHSWDMDCGEFRFKGSLSNSDIKSLKKSPIQSVFLKGTKHAKNITDITNKTYFIDALRCIE